MSVRDQKLYLKDILAAIDRVGYAGYLGLEFWPTMDDEVALMQAQGLVQDQD